MLIFILISFFFDFIFVNNPDSQKRNLRGVIFRATSFRYPKLLSKMPRYCCLIEKPNRLLFIPVKTKNDESFNRTKFNLPAKIRNGDKIPHNLDEALEMHMLVLRNMVGKISPANKIEIIITEIPKNLPIIARHIPATVFSDYNMINLSAILFILNIKSVNCYFVIKQL